MTTCRDIIKRAYQMTGVVALGDDPSAEEAQYGLEALQAMYDGWVENGMFGRLTDIYKTANYEAKEGERVITPSSTITLPATVDSSDGERAPRELSCIVKIVGGVQTSYVYHKGQWITLGGLTLASDAPFADRGAFGLSAALAMMITETFGATLTASTANAARQFLGGLSYKLGATPKPSQAEYF